MSRKPILFLATLLALSIWAAAQNPTTPPATPQAAAQPAAPVVIGPAKLAFVNMGLAIATCDEGKKEFAAVQSYVDQKSAELQRQQKEAEALKTKLDVQGSELETIDGGAKTFRRAGVALVETSFHALYAGQPTFPEVNRRLEELGFRYAGSLRQLLSPIDHAPLEQDAIFLRSE